MKVVRLTQIAMVASIALFFSLVAFNNIVDYKSNLQFVQHVMSMDTTFHSPTLMPRSITSPLLHWCAYLFIVGWELLTAIVCWTGSYYLFIHWQSSSAEFNQAKSYALIGLLLGFLLYMVGFLIVAGEWYSMWQSAVWNVQMKAGMFLAQIVLVMLFLKDSD